MSLETILRKCRESGFLPSEISAVAKTYYETWGKLKDTYSYGTIENLSTSAAERHYSSIVDHYNKKPEGK